MISENSPSTKDYTEAQFKEGKQQQLNFLNIMNDLQSNQSKLSIPSYLLKPDKTDANTLQNTNNANTNACSTNNSNKLDSYQSKDKDNSLTERDANANVKKEFLRRLYQRDKSKDKLDVQSKNEPAATVNQQRYSQPTNLTQQLIRLQPVQNNTESDYPETNRTSKPVISSYTPIRQSNDYLRQSNISERQINQLDLIQNEPDQSSFNFNRNQQPPSIIEENQSRNKIEDEINSFLKQSDNSYNYSRYLDNSPKIISNSQSNPNERKDLKSTQQKIFEIDQKISNLNLHLNRQHNIEKTNAEDFSNVSQIQESQNTHENEYDHSPYRKIAMQNQNEHYNKGGLATLTFQKHKSTDKKNPQNYKHQRDQILEQIDFQKEYIQQHNQDLPRSYRLDNSNDQSNHNQRSESVVSQNLGKIESKYTETTYDTFEKRNIISNNQQLQIQDLVLSTNRNTESIVYQDVKRMNDFSDYEQTIDSCNLEALSKQQLILQVQELKRQVDKLQDYKNKYERTSKQTERAKLQFAHSEKIRNNQHQLIELQSQKIQKIKKEYKKLKLEKKQLMQIVSKQKEIEMSANTTLQHSQSRTTIKQGQSSVKNGQHFVNNPYQNMQAMVNSSNHYLNLNPNTTAIDYKRDHSKKPTIKKSKDHSTHVQMKENKQCIQVYGQPQQHHQNPDKQDYYDCVTLNPHANHIERKLSQSKLNKSANYGYQQQHNNQSSRHKNGNLDKSRF
ncbi:UNKNOWN [Stylonychia lemnae]|uniref:Uncharacterized protein n=1 Tax=Stylonychia lemnae TaxID=5949 RepID=A0A078AD03_STYLE|nr:UNKNOWN [Stylonychia lemnae]|eukprot:CDW78738.1 UNKNOWN [Stylonychia lemnae]